ncbi:MAG TPA: lactate utilization protein C [Micromonosporaceae bacterium]
MSAREEVLARVRAALADRPVPPAVPREYRRSAAPGDADVVDLFVERAADYRATVTRVSPDGVSDAVAAALAGRGARRVAVPDGVPADWIAGADVDAVRDQPPLTVAELDRLDGVVTGCAVAIAEPGTIVLDGGSGQGRRALTLLPDYHLCVVRVDQIVATVPEALGRLDPRRPQTWISGPSATSDIELDRVEGVHGPRTLHILVVG